MAVRFKILSAAGLIAASIALAQNAPPATRPAMGDPMDAVKTQLKASDEEWQVISPVLRKVVAARRNADGGLVSGNQRPGGFGFGRGGRMGGPGMGNDAFGGPGGPGGMRGGPGGGPGGQGRGGWQRGGDGGPPGMGGPGGMPGDGPPPPGDNPQGGPPGGNAGNLPGGGPPNGGPPGGGPPGMGGPGGGPGGGPVAAAMNDLKTAAIDGKASADDIKAKVEAVRAARKQARANLATAVEELKALLAPEQEAVLIGLGYLE